MVWHNFIPKSFSGHPWSVPLLVVAIGSYIGAIISVIIANSTSDIGIKYRCTVWGFGLELASSLFFLFLVYASTGSEVVGRLFHKFSSMYNIAVHALMLVGILIPAVMMISIYISGRSSIIAFWNGRKIDKATSGASPFESAETVFTISASLQALALFFLAYANEIIFTRTRMASATRLIRGDSSAVALFVLTTIGCITASSISSGQIGNLTQG